MDALAVEAVTATELATEAVTADALTVEARVADELGVEAVAADMLTANASAADVSIADMHRAGSAHGYVHRESILVTTTSQLDRAEDRQLVRAMTHPGRQSLVRRSGMVVEMPELEKRRSVAMLIAFAENRGCESGGWWTPDPPLTQPR